MGSLLPLSITTNCTMKSLLILATVLAVGHSEETKAAVVAPYHYGIPGYYGGVAAPFVYPNASPVNYAYAPQTAYPYTYAPYAQAYAPVAAPVAAPAPVVAAAPAFVPPVSSQFHAGDELGFRTVDSRLPVAPVHDAELPVAPVHDAELPVAPVYDGVAPSPVEKTPEVKAAEAEHLAAVAELASRKKRESDPMVQGYGYNSAWILNPMYQRTMYNGIYAYNHLAYAGYNNPRFNYGFYY